jgi:hypothetical protein
MTPTLEMSLNLGSLSDVTAVLAADFEEGLRDLLRGADPGGVHEDGEDVVPGPGGVLEGLERGGCLGGVPLLEVPDPVQLGFLLLFGGAGEGDGVRRCLAGVGAAEGVDDATVRAASRLPQELAIGASQGKLIGLLTTNIFTLK